MLKNYFATLKFGLGRKSGATDLWGKSQKVSTVMENVTLLHNSTCTRQLKPVLLRLEGNSVVCCLKKDL